MNSRLPGVGDTVKTADGNTGEVMSVNVLKQLVKVIISTGGAEDDEKEAREYPVDKLQFRPKRRKDRGEMDADLRALEMLEKKEGHRLDD